MEMGLDFSKLAYLRLRCKQILEDQVASIDYFAHDEGYQHYKGKDKISVSSSATCALSLTATGSWRAHKARTKALLSNLISKKTSAGLPENNPFTVAWVLEALTALKPYSDDLEPAEIARVAEMEQILQEGVKEGAVAIKPDQREPSKTGTVEINYPPTAYLTQL